MLGNLIAAGANLIGGFMGQKSQEKMADKNIQLQQEFAKKGIRWKVKDAKAAGLHPLAALGASTHSFSPVTVGDSLSPAIGAAGQDLSRAIDSTRTQPERVQAISDTVQRLQVQNMALKNEYLAAQIARVKQPGNGPGLPGGQELIPGQGDTNVAASTPTSAVMGGTADAGLHPDISFSKTNRGYAVNPSYSSKQSFEDMPFSEVQWAIRNQVLPAFGFNRQPPPYQVPEGYDNWVYNMWTGEYVPMRKGYFGLHY